MANDQQIKTGDKLLVFSARENVWQLKDILSGSPMDSF